MVALVVAALLAGVFYISYTALSGLPWARTYDVYVHLPNAERLVVNDSVRIHGVRVGRVAEVEAEPARGTQPAYSRIKLALDKSSGPLPIDTTVRARAASVLGASFVALDPGRSERTHADGSTLPLDRATGTVGFTDLFDAFDQATSRNIRGTFDSLATGFAGRGPAFSETLAATGTLLVPLTRVSRTLAAPGTRLGPLISSYGRFADELGPVGPQLAGLVAGGATTFGALSSERQALGAAIDAAPGAEQDFTTALTSFLPALDGLADIATDLRPAAAHLRRDLGVTNDALAAGITPLRKAPPFATALTETLATVRRVSRRRSTPAALRKVAELAGVSNPAVTALEAAQTECNVVGVTMDIFAEVVSAFPGAGSTLPGILQAPTAMVGLTHLGAQGEIFQSTEPAPNVAINYLPHENADECEAGNEGHDGRSQALGNPPGNQSKVMPPSYPAPGSLDLARKAGLLKHPEGWTP